MNATDQSRAVSHVDGSQITLRAEMAGSGARYAPLSDGARYVWWTKGAEASLYWKDAQEETLLLTCAQMQ